MDKKKEAEAVEETGTLVEEPQPRIEVKHGERTLSVRLTQAELLEQAKKMAEAAEDAEVAESNRKAMSTHYKAQAEEAEGKEKAARTLLRNGYDYRPVKITVTKNWDTKQVVITRDDTGEVIEARDMTAKELQIPIPGTTEEQKPEAPTAEPEKTEENTQPEQPAA